MKKKKDSDAPMDTMRSSKLASPLKNSLNSKRENTFMTAKNSIQVGDSTNRIDTKRSVDKKF